MTEVSTSTETSVVAPAAQDTEMPVGVPPSVAPDTVADSFTTAAVEWDHTGRVVSSRFTGGHQSHFRYDANGNLYAFSYAKLAWSTIDGVNWTARDQYNDWTMAGRVDVGVDGTIRIELGTLTRTLKLNGTMVDEFSDGSVVEVTRPTPEPAPADLMASCAPRASVREPQALMREPQGLMNSGIDAAAPAGAPPSGHDDEDDDDSITGRRVFAGGRRMKRLRLVEDAAPAPATPTFAEETKSYFDGLLSSTAVRLLEMTKGPHAPELPPFLDRLAQTCHRERRIDEARMLHERALQIRARCLGPDHADTGINQHGLGKIYLEWGRYVEAEQYLLDAVKVFEKGLRKARFMLATEAVDPAFVTRQLANLINALHTLSSLYHEQRKLHLCAQLHDTAVSAANSVDPALRAGIDVPLQSLSAMAAQAELQFKKPEGRIRATF